MRLHQLLLISALASLLLGCLESRFELSPESRIPKWFAIPEGNQRGDYKVTAEYYSTFNGAEDVFKLYEKDSFFCTQKVTASTKEGNLSKSVILRNSPEGSPKGYPKYRVITIGGVTDIIEHRKMEPIFYTTDDPAVWRELGVNQ